MKNGEKLCKSDYPPRLPYPKPYPFRPDYEPHTLIVYLRESPYTRYHSDSTSASWFPWVGDHQTWPNPWELKPAPGEPFSWNSIDPPGPYAPYRFQYAGEEGSINA